MLGSVGKILQFLSSLAQDFIEDLPRPHDARTDGIPEFSSSGLH